MEGANNHFGCLVTGEAFNLRFITQGLDQTIAQLFTNFGNQLLTDLAVLRKTLSQLPGCQAT